MMKEATNTETFERLWANAEKRAPAGSKVVAISMLHGYVLESGMAEDGMQLEFKNGAWREKDEVP